MSRMKFSTRITSVLLALAGICAARPAAAQIQGVVPSGNAITLTAGADRISTPDGGSVYFWGFSTPASNGGRVQYPAPTLILTEGQTYTITVANKLPSKFGQNVSFAIAIAWKGVLRER